MRTPPELTPEDTVAEFKAWLSKPGNGDAPCTCGEKLADHYADLSGCAGNVECPGFNLDRDRAATAQSRPAITQTEINRAVSHVLPDGPADLAMLQVIMLGPDLVEVKARRAADNEWFEGVVHRRHWADENP